MFGSNGRARRMPSDNRYCPNHKLQKMTQLFSSYVCDICDPPKTSISTKPSVPESFRWALDHGLSNPDLELIVMRVVRRLSCSGIPELTKIVSPNSEQLFELSDVVFHFTSHGVNIIKNRYGNEFRNVNISSEEREDFYNLMNSVPMPVHGIPGFPKGLSCLILFMKVRP
jgi:RNA polymerase subunit RPABC4/transcription elongation factor Spt4